MEERIESENKNIDSDKENCPTGEQEIVSDICYDLNFTIPDKFFSDDCTISELSDIIFNMSVELNIFMNKLSKLNPDAKMIGEIRYWKKMWELLSLFYLKLNYYLL